MKSNIAFWGFMLALLLPGALPVMCAVDQPVTGSPDNPAPVPSLAAKITIDFASGDATPGKNQRPAKISSGCRQSTQCDQLVQPVLG